MTSTYRPPFFFFAPAPFLACGAPSKSSILLALLIDVLGLEGGPDAAPNEGRASVGGFGPSLSEGASDGRPGVEALDPGKARGGGIEELRCSPGLDVGGRRDPLGGPIGGAAPPDALLAAPEGGPLLGGGGVAAGLPVSVEPPFLFTHFLSSGS